MNVCRWGLVGFALLALTACTRERSDGAGSAEPPRAAGADTARAAFADTASADPGLAVFARVCAPCHMRHGRGIPGQYPPLLGSHWVKGETSFLIRIVLHGLEGPVNVLGQTYRGVMPPWRSLSDREVADALSYVRRQFGDGASAVTPEEVAAERAATADRTRAWTVRELAM